MKTLLSIIICLLTFALSAPQSAAQQGVAKLVEDNSSMPAVENNATAPRNSTPAGVDALRKRRAALSRYLETVAPSSSDYDATVNAIRGLDVQLHSIMARTTTVDARSAQAATPPKFSLATPGDNLTNESVQPTLSWTEDQNPAPRALIQKYIVEISDQDDFSSIVYRNDEVKPRPHPLTIQHAVPEDILQPGVTYHWRVLAVYTLTPDSPPATEPSQETFSFTTARSIFRRFSDKGFSLQRTVEGPDAGKGAAFAFLRTLGKSSVFTADFALIHNYRFPQTSRTSVGIQSSVDGKLTSAESESEDAWRFRLGAVIDRNLKPGTLNLIYLSLGGKFEGDQDFDIRKMSFEALFTPTFPKLAIGVSTPLDTASPFQFRWRPFLGLDLGRTIKRGSSEEIKNTIFRLTPRVTAKLKLNFLNEMLKLNEVYLWMDNTFYFLPLESKTKRNFFTSGLEFEVTDNLGFGMTYKNGEAAPKFNRINTLGANISIRFNRSGQ